jgi:hypothetical protein
LLESLLLLELLVLLLLESCSFSLASASTLSNLSRLDSKSNSLGGTSIFLFLDGVRSVCVCVCVTVECQVLVMNTWSARREIYMMNTT